MKKLYVFISVLASLSMFAQKTIEKEFKLSNGGKKKVKIFTPKGYETDTVHKYPVTIVLDDGFLFDLTKGNAKLFAEADLAPKQIIVGIPTNFDPNKDVSIISKNLTLTKNSRRFYNFVKNDILTYLKAKYKTSPFKTIVGQGPAASFATFYFSESKPAFNAIVAITPSLTENFNKLLSTYDFKRFETNDNTYFLYVSGTPFQSKKTRAAFKQLKEGITSYELKRFNSEFDSFKTTPSSVSAISESVPRAFSQIFEIYRNISRKEYQENIKDLAPLGAIEYLEKKYIDIDYLYGTNTNVREKDFYAIEKIVTEQQNGDYLRVLGDFALIKLPDSPLGDYYMGKFYELGKEYERADNFYKSGYGKMDPSDPKADGFYKNIARVRKLVAGQPVAAPIKEPLEEDEEDKDEE